MAVGIEKTTYKSCQERDMNEENSHCIPLNFLADVINNPNLSEVKKLFSRDGYVNRNTFSSFISDDPAESILKFEELWTRWAEDVARTDGELRRKMFQRQIKLLKADLGDTCEIRPSEHHTDFLADSEINRPAHSDHDELANDCNVCGIPSEDAYSSEHLLSFLHMETDEQPNPSYRAPLENDYNMAQIDAAWQQLCRENGEGINFTAEELCNKIEEINDGHGGFVGESSLISDADARRKVTCMVCVKNEVGSLRMQAYRCLSRVFTKITHCPECGSVVEERVINRMKK